MTDFTSLRTAAVLLGGAIFLAGCSGSGNELTTSSLFGGKKPDAVAAPAPAPQHTPQTRAFEVAATSARAARCGYNFDAGRLKGGFVAAEAQGGLAADQLANVEKAYDTTHAAVAKAIVSDGDYCTEARTRIIKDDLTRYLSGNYAPPQRAQQLARKEEGGLFGGLFNNDCPDCNKPLTADSFYDITGRAKNSR